MKDTLYLLKPGFLDGHSSYFCPECALVEGMLSFYPFLREKIEVRYIAYARPRPEMVEELGQEHQSLPCIVIRDPSRAEKAPMGVEVRSARGKHFVAEPTQICTYLAAEYGADRPH